MLADKLEVREHTLYGFRCRGLFAAETIKAGEVVWSYKEGTEILRTYNKHHIDALPDSSAKSNIITYSYMLDDDLFGSTPTPEEDPSYFFNHSCAPNCWYSGDNCIVAMRDINRDEHVVYDYAMTETEGSLHAGLECRCGAGREGGKEGRGEEGMTCRGVLRFDDWRRASWAERYSGHARMARGEGGMVEGGEGGGKEKGLFLTAAMRKGEVVLVFAGKVVGMEGLLAAGRRNMELSLQINDTLWQIPSTRGPETSDFVNHSCDANSGMEDSTTVVAIRDMRAGEEVTIDYATVNSGINTSEGDNFQCRCQAKGCRGTVTSRDWMLPDVQEKYWPYFPPFVRRLILSQAATASGRAGGSEGGREGWRGETKGMIPSSMSVVELS
ncbi:nuclear protein set [Nannochloropsis oceanica]